MATSTCPICNAAVDSSDAVCRQCGVEFLMRGPQPPVITLSRPVRYRTVPTVVELTSKRWKSIMVLGVLVAVTFGGLCAVAALLIQPEPGSVEMVPVLVCAALSAGGIVIYALGRLGAWWNHG